MSVNNQEVVNFYFHQHQGQSTVWIIRRMIIDGVVNHRRLCECADLSVAKYIKIALENQSIIETLRPDAGEEVILPKVDLHELRTRPLLPVEHHLRPGANLKVLWERARNFFRRKDE